MLLLPEMRRHGVRCDTTVCSSAVRACEQGRLWAQALGLLARMRRDALQPDATAYTSALRASESCGSQRSASALRAALEGRVRRHLVADDVGADAPPGSPHCTVGHATSLGEGGGGGGDRLVGRVDVIISA